MDIFKTVLIFTFLGLGGTVAKLNTHDCNEIEKFTKEYGALLKQLTAVTYPVNSFCTSNSTIWHYKAAVEWFHYAQGNKTCEANLNQNRLNVFQMLYDDMTSLWDAAHCQDCVSNQNDTAEFFDYYDGMQNCTRNYTNPCDVCAGNYSRMQVYYEGLVQNRRGAICFDIEDRMNQTRYAWSAIYNCCKGKQHSQTAFIWFASGISSLPVIFYVMMYLVTCRKEARERAAASLLNDQSVAGTVDGRAEPQASTSSVSQQQLFVEGKEEDEQSSAEAEPKLNNLDKAAGVRESKLIDLDNESNKNINSDRDLKSLPTKHDEDDDVSILRVNPNVSGGVENLLD